MAKSKKEFAEEVAIGTLQEKIARWKIRMNVCMDEYKALVKEKDKLEKEIDRLEKKYKEDE